MNPPTAVERPSAQPASIVRRGLPWAVLATVVGVVLLLVLAVAISSDHYVAHVSFVNPTPYEFDVQVAPGPHDGWMGIGTAERRTTTSFGAVYDLGGQWWFRYSAQGRTSQAFRLTRDQLQRAHWTVSVPAEIGRRLQADGVPVQP